MVTFITGRWKEFQWRMRSNAFPLKKMAFYKLDGLFLRVTEKIFQLVKLVWTFEFR